MFWKCRDECRSVINRRVFVVVVVFNSEIFGHNITHRPTDTNLVTVSDLCRRKLFLFSPLSPDQQITKNKCTQRPYNLYLLTILIQAIYSKIVVNRCLELFCIVIPSRADKSYPLTVISIYTDFW